MQNSKRDIRTKSVLRAYLKAAGEYPWLTTFALLSMAGAQVAGVIAPIYLKDILNAVATNIPAAGMPAGLIAALVFFALTQLILWVFQRTSDFSLLYMELNAMRDLYNDAFAKLMRHSHEFFASNFTGTLTRRVTRYARAFERVWDYFNYEVVSLVVYLVGAVGILSTQNLWLGIGLLVWAIAFILLQIFLVQRLQPLRVATNEADSAATGSVSDAVVNHAAITSFAALKQERRIFSEAIARFIDMARVAWSANMRLIGWLALFNGAANVALLAGAVYYWRLGILTVGDFLLIEMYIMGLMNRVWGVGRNLRNLFDAFAEATEMLDIIERPRDIVDIQDALDLTVSTGSIAFDHVRFSYHDGQNVLDDFNLNIAPHEKIALVGLSGAGKTTITKLLLRLYDVTSGTITIDGQNIAQVTQDSLRRAISFVPQEPMLFHRSLMENIRYGRPEATDDEIIAAAKQAHCYEFISQYPEGFDTLVGERGVKLSGGERQRVAIARAILKDAPILVLDEATSSLDSESEHLIQDALAALMEGKTVIAVAHRLSTIMKMDRIIVMEKGAITTTGTHAELLAHDENLYKKLWDIQAGGFITE